MKPSEQLTDEQRKRVRDISTAIWDNAVAVYPDHIEHAIYRALDELVPEMAKDAARYSVLSNRVFMAPVVVDPISFHTRYTKDELDIACDSCIKRLESSVSKKRKKQNEED